MTGAFQAICLKAALLTLIVMIAIVSQVVIGEALTAKVLPYTNSCFGTTVANVTNTKIYFYFAVIS